MKSHLCRRCPPFELSGRKCPRSQRPCFNVTFSLGWRRQHILTRGGLDRNCIVLEKCISAFCSFSIIDMRRYSAWRWRFPPQIKERKISKQDPHPIATFQLNGSGECFINDVVLLETETKYLKIVWTMVARCVACAVQAVFSCDQKLTSYSHKGKFLLRLLTYGVQKY